MAKQTVAEKRDGEKLLVSEMIALYCRKQHGTPKGSLCPECQQVTARRYIHDTAHGNHQQVARFRFVIDHFSVLCQVHAVPRCTPALLQNRAGKSGCTLLGGIDRMKSQHTAAF